MVRILQCLRRKLTFSSVLKLTFLHSLVPSPQGPVHSPKTWEKMVICRYLESQMKNDHAAGSHKDIIQHVQWTKKPMLYKAVTLIKDLEPFVKAMYRKLEPFVLVLTHRVQGM